MSLIHIACLLCHNILMAQHIYIEDWNPCWARRFEEERAVLQEILGIPASSIHHIGSTSVPFLAAKPVIDILIGIDNLSHADACRKKLEDVGYEWMGEYGISGRRYLRKGGDERTHQIHIFRNDDRENIARHLAFRDYLRTHEAERKEYEALKRALAHRFSYDIEGYSDGKASFIRDLERKAMEEYQ